MKRSLLLLIGLLAVKILAPGFYARQDIRTPVKIAIAVLAEVIAVRQGIRLRDATDAA